MAETDPSQGPPPEEGPPMEPGPPLDVPTTLEKPQENEGGGGEMKVQVKQTGLQAFSNFLYDKETGAVLGRTGRRWLKILIFYIIFYTAIFAFFFLLIFIMLQCMPIDQPRLFGKKSLLKDSPGLSFRPENGKADSSLIWFNKNNEDDTNFYSNQLKAVVDLETRLMNAIDCDKKKPNATEVCRVYALKENKTEWGGCTVDNKFGYKYGTPCVLIRLNQIIDWKPANEKPSPPPNLNFPEVNIMKGHVLIDCRGETQLDNELMGNINVFPNRSQSQGQKIGMTLPPNYFPYKKGNGYLPPFVMIQFSGPTRGALIRVRCNAYNKNVVIEKRDGLGTVMIELLVDA